MKILFAEGDLNLIRGKYRGKEKEKKENKSSITSPTRNAERGPAKVEYRVEFIGIPEGMSWIRASEI